jgi:hypothetical protein
MILTQHFHEWQESGISDELIEANLSSLRSEPHGARDEAIQLLYDTDSLDRDNLGRIRGDILRKNKNLNDGGWYARGYDLTSGNESSFLCLKPDNPRWDFEKQKPIKYEHPRGMSAGIFAPKVPIELGDLLFANFEDWQEFRDAWEGDPYFCAWAFALQEPGVAIGITEGYKKACKLIEEGILSIAVPGVWNWIDKDAERYTDFKGKSHRKKVVTREISPLCHPQREFIFFFDEDEKESTRTNVFYAKRAFGRALSGAGGKVSLCSWQPEDGKGIDDAIVNRGIQWFQQILQERLSLSAWLYWEDQLKWIDQRYDKRYLSASDISNDAKILGIKSAKGTGKTEALAEYCQRYVREGIPVLLVSHRVQLVRELADRLGIDSVYEFRSSETKGALGIALCADSLHEQGQAQFDSQNWDDFLLILDECEQVIPHILISKHTSVADHRCEVLGNFSELCQKARQIILSDADLSDRSISYIGSLTGYCSRHIVVNDFQPAKGRKLHNYPSEEAWLNSLVDAVSSGEKILIPIDAQREKSAWSSSVLEEFLKLLFPNEPILRIDKNTISNPDHPAYRITKRLDQTLRYYTIVIYTPVLGTGVSIDLQGHFDAVYSLNHGSQSENSTRQFLARLREGIPRHCFFKKIGVGQLDGGYSDRRQLLKATKRRTEQNLKLLRKLEAEAFDFGFYADHTKTYCDYVARHNLSLSAYRETVLQGLKLEGYEIINEPDLDPQERQDIRQGIKQQRDDCFNALIEAINKANSPTDSEFNKLQNKQELTDDQRYQLEKGKIEKKYQVQSNEELIEKDHKDQLYGKLSLWFFLSLGRHLVEERDQQRAQAYREAHGNKGYEPDFNRTQYQSQVILLELLRIPELLESCENGEVSNQSLSWWWEHIESLDNQHFNFRTGIKQVLNVTISDKESIVRNAQKLVRKVGRNLKFKKQLGHNQERMRIYSLEKVYSGEAEILSAWLKKLEAELERDTAPPLAS